MSSKAQRIAMAAVAITASSAAGMVGPVIGAVAADYALQQLEKKRGGKKSGAK